MRATLIKELKLRQGAQTDKQFAAVLGIHAGELSRVYAGKRLIGERVGRCIVRAYPDLRWLVAGYIMEKEEGERNDNRSID